MSEPYGDLLPVDRFALTRRHSQRADNITFMLDTDWHCVALTSAVFTF